MTPKSLHDEATAEALRPAGNRPGAVSCQWPGMNPVTDPLPTKLEPSGNEKLIEYAQSWSFPLAGVELPFVLPGLTLVVVAPDGSVKVLVNGPKATGISTAFESTACAAVKLPFPFTTAS